MKRKMTWIKLIVAIAVLGKVHGENEPHDGIALVQQKMIQEDELSLSTCPKADQFCFWPCVVQDDQVGCDACTSMMCPAPVAGAPQNPPTTPEECLYMGANLDDRVSLKGMSIGCLNMDPIAATTQEECLTEGQAHNGKHIAWNALTNTCTAVPLGEACNPGRALLNFHYFDCNHQCHFNAESKCVFIEDDGGAVTGNTNSGNKPRVLARAVDAGTCLHKCEEAAESAGTANEGCCQWNQKRANCRYYANTNGNAGTSTTARNRQKWSVELSDCS